MTVIALSLGAATAASGRSRRSTRCLSSLARQGFGAFEVDRENGQLKVEARRGAIERELTYDAATGKLSRTRSAGATTASSTGATTWRRAGSRRSTARTPGTIDRDDARKRRPGRSGTTTATTTAAGAAGATTTTETTTTGQTTGALAAARVGAARGARGDGDGPDDHDD